MSDEKVYMRFNNPKAKWEPINYSWGNACFLLGDQYDLKLVRDGYETIKLIGKESVEEGLQIPNE